MNEIRPRDREAEETHRIREIVSRHKLPDFVTGFDVKLGSFEGEPGAWITFNLTDSDDVGLDELERRADLLVPLHEQLFDELVADMPERFPFLRVQYSLGTRTDP